MNQRQVWRCVGVLVLAIHCGAPGWGGDFDWPQFRGPQGDGISLEGDLLPSWPEAGPPKLWRGAIGEGYSSISVRGDTFCTLDASGEEEFVFCAELASGSTLWRRRLDALYRLSHGNGPRSTPTLGDRHLWAISGSGRLAAFDLDGGRELWAVRLADALGKAESLLFGYSMSPVLADGHIIVAAGGDEGSLVAGFDATTGELRWKTGSGEATYSTPLQLGSDTKSTLIVQSAEELLAMTPEGKVLWTWPWVGRPVKAAMPVAVPPDHLFVSMSYDVGALMLRLPKGSEPAREAWQGRTMRNHFNSSVVVDGRLYGFDNATLKCLDPLSGETLWQKSRLGGKGSLIAADGKLIVLNERGYLRLVDADCTSYTEISGFQAMTGRSWSPPALAHGYLLLRDQDEMVAFDLRPHSRVGVDVGREQETGR